METKEKTLFTTGEKWTLVGILSLIVLAFGLVASDWKESPIEKTVPGQAVIHLFQTQPTVVGGQKCLNSTITFLRVNGKETTTEQVLISEENFTAGLLTKLLFKSNTDSLYYLPHVDLEHYKNGTKRLVIPQTKTGSPGV